MWNLHSGQCDPGIYSCFPSNCRELNANQSSSFCQLIFLSPSLPFVPKPSLLLWHYNRSQGKEQADFWPTPKYLWGTVVRTRKKVKLTACWCGEPAHAPICVHCPIGLKTSSRQGSLSKMLQLLFPPAPPGLPYLTVFCRALSSLAERFLNRIKLLH